ncbi:MAG: winged helix-turn-helix domain-containing protein [Gemmatimonadaceae bacterium]|nr:winged helix-turn-helix domain-containing protein [Gemmatimonadaceae bacterium]
MSDPNADAVGEHDRPIERDAPLSFTFFGATVLRRGSANDPQKPIFTAGKPLALLAFLACSPGNGASREQLIDLLWSDVEPEAARHTLRQTLWYVRRKLGVIHSQARVIWFA